MYVKKKLNQEMPKCKSKYEEEYNAVLKFIESDDDNMVLVYETPYDARLVYTRLYGWAIKHNLPIEVRWRDKKNVIVQKEKGA